MIFDLNDRTAVGVIRTYCACERGKSRTIGLTSGSFDLIHFHHTLYFTRCRRSCDILVVGVDSDEFVREKKGPGRPVIYDSRRVFMVDNQKPVAFAFIMNSVEDFGRAAEFFRPEFIFKNNDFEGRETEIVCKEFAGEVKIISDVVAIKRY
ncbi:adenylyltransferase/cytidyltransferase family protein [bacterium]|nr:adenylyltransferase/cytidyltransferase family protein [bacterium]